MKTNKIKEEIKLKLRNQFYSNLNVLGISDSIIDDIINEAFMWGEKQATADLIKKIEKLPSNNTYCKNPKCGKVTDENCPDCFVCGSKNVEHDIAITKEELKKQMLVEK